MGKFDCTHPQFKTSSAEAGSSSTAKACHQREPRATEDTVRMSHLISRRFQETPIDGVLVPILIE